MTRLGVTLPGVTAPAAHPQSAAAPPGLQACAGTANTPRCCIIYKPEEQRARQQLQSPRGPPCPASRSPQPAGTVAPQPPQPEGTTGTRLPVGLAEPRGTQMSPWRPLGCRGRLVQHVGMSGVSLCPAQWPLASACCHLNPFLPPQPASCHLSLPPATPTRSCHNLPPATQPPSCPPDLPAVTPGCCCLCVTSLQMELGDGSEGVSPRPAPGGTRPSPGCATAPCSGRRMWPQHFLPPWALLATANRFSLSFAESTHLLPPYEYHLQADGEKEGGRGGERLNWGF